MNIKTAQAAIRAILAAIPDDELPKFDRVEQRDGKTIVWWGGNGYHLGSATSGGKRDVKHHHRCAPWDAIEREMVYRADRKFLKNGDKLDGIHIAAKVVG